MKTEKRPINADLKEGDHTCSIYKSKEEKYSILIPYFKTGLLNNEKCIYVIHDKSESKIISEFEKRGLDIKEYIKSNQFEFITTTKMYSLQEEFDSDTVINSVKAKINQSLKQGFTRVRATAEMEWILDNKEYINKSREYESKLNQVFPHWKIMTICQYNENIFSEKILNEVIHTHQIIFFNGKKYKNKYYFTPQIISAEKNEEFPEETYSMIKEDIIAEN